MLLKPFFVLCLVSVAKSQRLNESDAESSGTDFVPQYQPFPSFRQGFEGAGDPIAPRRTHTPDLDRGFPSGKPSTQSSAAFDGRTLVARSQQGPAGLPDPRIPPPSSSSASSSSSPSSQQFVREHASGHILARSRPQANVPQNFDYLAGRKYQTSFGDDQYIKNSFPSNAPHTIKFSISSQNYDPEQNKRFANSQRISAGGPSQIPFGSATRSHQTGPPPIIQQPNQNFGGRSNFQNLNPNEQEIVTNRQNVDSNQTSFGSVPTLVSPVSPHVPNSPTGYVRPGPTDGGAGIPFAENRFPSSAGHGNFQVLDFGRNDGRQVMRDRQGPFVRPDFEFPQSSSFPPDQAIVRSTPQTSFHFRGSQSFEDGTRRGTVSAAETFSGGLREGVRTSGPPSPTPGPAQIFADSTDRSRHSGTPPVATVRTLASPHLKKPKPIVKEITVDLDRKKISGDDIPAQLYIKEDRQKEFSEIREQEEKDRRKGKKGKSREDVISEQIQKLLQSHNLEIIDDQENDSQTESQEAQLSRFSEQLGKKYNYSVQLLNGGSLLGDVKPPRKKQATTTLPPLPDLPDHIKKQYDIKLVSRDELLKQFHLPGDHDLGNDSSKVFLADGQRLEIVEFTKDGITNKIPVSADRRGSVWATPATATTATTTPKPPKILFEELAKGVIPPGADFELIKHKGDGQVEKVKDLTDAKKVTFVFLEEQPDGSVKIQGVKGNGNQATEETESVDSLIEKIKDGSLKLPPSTQTEGKSLVTNEIPRIGGVSHPKNHERFAAPTAGTPREFPTSTSPTFLAEKDQRVPGRGSSSTDFPHGSPYAVDVDSTRAPTRNFYETQNAEPPATPFVPAVDRARSSTRKPRTRVTFLPTQNPGGGIDAAITPTFASKRIRPTTSFPVGKFRNSQNVFARTSSKYEEPEHSDSEILSHRPTEYSGQRLRVPQDVVGEETNVDAVRPLKDVLKENGLNEMAKFLDRSGLDTILNETGPYTIFVPTDKAFKTLEAQLGGEDKADDKFRENPRLLSGLLLHHVVPGSFRLEDLQDEMTGVSLAGTQLRVNAYSANEKTSNHRDKTITVNGAKISNEKKDIAVPQGLAHSIDRVLFPLPVGDILQTLRGDRERRFTKFLKSLESSGLTDMLTGSKTYTVFAPTDKAFSVLTDSELDKLLTRREAARTIVLRHVVPGTLYSAGMNYFQVKDSMETGQKIVIKKELGKIKANSAQIISSNIPATNGVVHAVESLL